MIADAIRTYLEGQRREDASLALMAANRLGRRLMQQSMQGRRHKKALSATMVTKACARRAALDLANVPESNPMTYRTSYTFWTGDALEVKALVDAELAGVPIHDNNEETNVRGIVCHPDGWMVAAGPEYGANDGKPINVEIKSMSSYSFEKSVAAGRVDDAFGYATQASMEIEGWRASEPDWFGAMDLTEFVLINKNTGEVASVLEPYSESLVDSAAARAEAATGGYERIGILAKTNGKMPLLCRYCPWMDFCHGEKK